MCCNAPNKCGRVANNAGTIEGNNIQWTCCPEKRYIKRFTACCPAGYTSLNKLVVPPGGNAGLCCPDSKVCGSGASMTCCGPSQNCSNGACVGV
jgi:hypothetical protein